MGDALDRFDAIQQRAMRYCTTCPKMCRFACPVAHEEARESVTPWGLLSLVHAATHDSGTVTFDADLADLLQRCTGCHRCREACVHDNDVPSVVYTARSLAREQGLLSDVEGADGVASRHGRARDESEAGIDGRALGFAPDGDVAFVPACDMLDGSYRSLRQMARLLRELGHPPLLMTGGHACCGAPLRAAGQEGLFRDRFASRARALAGVELVVTNCDDWLGICRSEWGSRELERAGVGRVVHWTEFLGDGLERLTATPVAEVAYHDGCRLVRDGGVADAPRAIVSWATAGEWTELPDRGSMSLCCGAGAGYDAHDPESARAIGRALLDTAPSTASILVTSRSHCVSHLRATEGPRVLSLFELVLLALGW